MRKTFDKDIVNHQVLEPSGIAILTMMKTDGVHGR